jgi:hypothetical protein
MSDVKQLLNRNALAVEMYTANPAVDAKNLVELAFDSEHPSAVTSRELAYEYTDDMLRAISTLSQVTEDYVNVLKFQYTMMFVTASTVAAGAFYI